MPRLSTSSSFYKNKFAVFLNENANWLKGTCLHQFEGFIFLWEIPIYSGSNN